MRSNIRRHEISIYFGLVLLISWGGSLVAGGTNLLQGKAPDSNLWLVGLAMLAGPSIAGIVMTYLTDGKIGLQKLYARMRNWQVGNRWYAALLIFPVLIFLVSLTLYDLYSSEFKTIFLPWGILIGLFAGFIEEIGWMGFVFPKMQAKLGLFRAGLYLGFFHGLWHLLADFLGQSTTLGKYWLPYFIAFVVFVMALRILIAWVYAHTGSLLLAQLMHASSTGFLVILIPTDIAPINWVVFYASYAAILWIVVAVILARSGNSLFGVGIINGRQKLLD